MNILHLSFVNFVKHRVALEHSPRDNSRGKIPPLRSQETYARASGSNSAIQLRNRPRNAKIAYKFEKYQFCAPKRYSTLAILFFRRFGQFHLVNGDASHISAGRDILSNFWTRSCQNPRFRKIASKIERKYPARRP